MAAEIEEDGSLFAGFFRFCASSIAALMAWDGSGAGTIPSVRANITADSKAARCLMAVASINPCSRQQTDHWRGAVVAKSAGVDARRDEAVSQGVHLDQRGEHSRVTEVVGVNTTGQRRTGGRLGGDDADRLACQLLPHEGEADAGEVGPPPTQPMTTSGKASAISSCWSASCPITV